MLGIRPIKVMIQSVLCEQAPSHSMHHHFCMAELLHILQILYKNLLMDFTFVMYAENSGVFLVNCKILK